MQVAGAAGAFYGNPRQLGIQLAGIVTTMVFSFIMTLILIVPLDLVRACVRACVRRVRACDCGSACAHVLIVPLDTDR